MSPASSSFLEKAPLAARDWIVALFPTALQWLVHQLITIVAVLAVFGLFFALTLVCAVRGLGMYARRWLRSRANDEAQAVAAPVLVREA